MAGYGRGRKDLRDSIQLRSRNGSYDYARGLEVGQAENYFDDSVRRDNYEYPDDSEYERDNCSMLEEAFSEEAETYLEDDAYASQGFDSYQHYQYGSGMNDEEHPSYEEEDCGGSFRGIDQSHFDDPMTFYFPEAWRNTSTISAAPVMYDSPGDEWPDRRKRHVQQSSPSVSRKRPRPNSMQDRSSSKRNRVHRFIFTLKCTSSILFHFIVHVR
jgi:hypothetical protein